VALAHDELLRTAFLGLDAKGKEGAIVKNIAPLDAADARPSFGRLRNARP
jgi:hypothetical protein